MRKPSMQKVFSGVSEERYFRGLSENGFSCVKLQLIWQTTCSVTIQFIVK